MFKRFFENKIDKCSECGKFSYQVKLFPNGDKLTCNKCLTKGEAPLITKGIGKNWSDLVTPKNFKQFIGQEATKSELDTMLKATNKTHIPVQHVLFSGNFGLGKTTLAKIFAGMVGSNSYVTAANIRDARDLPLTKVVIVDEIHTISNEEWLLTIMDKGEQTILGCTTTAGSLSGPLRSRFVSLVLQPYSIEELQEIVRGAANNLKYECPDFVTYEVARRGKTVARTAILLFKRIYDRAILSEKPVSEKILSKWFQEMSIDVDGLDNADRAYLNCLSDKPIGLQNLSAMTGMDRITIEESIEPFLLTHGFVKRTPKGRIVGDKKVITVW